VHSRVGFSFWEGNTWSSSGVRSAGGFRTIPLSVRITAQSNFVTIATEIESTNGMPNIAGKDKILAVEF
jgi:hypothetical protein